MSSTSDAPMTPPDRSPAVDAQTRYSRKAWRVLIASFLIFAVLVSSAGIGVLTYRAHATRPRTGQIDEYISGSQVFIQPPQQIGFRLLSGSNTVAEGDTVQTPVDTRVRIVLFDGTAVELSGGTTVKFDRLRSSQYLDNSPTIVLQQVAGRTIIDTSADTGFRRANVAIATPSGRVTAQQPGTRFRVLVLPEQGAQPETTSISVLEGSTVTVGGAGQQVVVKNGQESSVSAGLAPTPPTDKRRDLVVNGTFGFDPNEIGKPATGWQQIATMDLDAAGVTPGRAELVDTVVRGQKTTALHLVRDGGNFDNAQVGLEQVFPFGELDEFDQVTLTADVKVVSHSLSAGGDIGSEYPLIILLRYEDSRSLPQPDKGWGFYTQNDAGNRTNNGTLIGQQLVANTWTPFTIDIKMLRPAPYKLVNLQVYASGHDFDAYIANIAIVAK